MNATLARPPEAEGSPVTIGVVSLTAYGLFVPGSARRYGGSEVQLARLCRAVAARPGYHVVLITSGEGPFTTILVDGVEVRKLPWRPDAGSRGKLLLAWRLRREIARLAPDLYVQRCLGIETGLVGSECRRRGVPFIYMTASDWDCDGTYDRERPAWITRISHRGMRAADLILTQTERHRAMLRATYGLESKVLPSLCDLPTPAPWPRAHWLWVGRCEQSKRPDLFLDLAQAFPAESFVLIAPVGNDPALFESIRARARQLSNVRFLAGVPYHEMDQYYRAAKGLINTATQEGFPNVFLEASKHGAPILSLAVNPDEYLTRHAAGICVSGDWQAMKSQLSAWCSDETTLAKMGESGRHYIAQHHATERVLQAFLSHLHSLLTRPKT
ncbi:glycosyltransferase family 4 protein [bacterium]|nr:glycosyltransferase family 4 protein [bacterium]